MNTTASEYDDSMAAEQPVSPEWRSSRLNRQEFEQAKASVLDVLRTYGITRLIVGYDGCDDEGGFDLLAYYPFSAISLSEIPATPAMMRLREVRGRAPGAYSIVDAAFDLAFLPCARGPLRRMGNG